MTNAEPTATPENTQLIMAGRNRCLDGLRAVAIVLTFCVHFFGGYLATFRGTNPHRVPMSGLSEPIDKLMFWLYHSHHGVSIFFVLSGFLIARLSLRADFSYATFVRNRVLRVYPAFVFALSLCLVAGLSVGIVWPPWTTIAANLLFLNALPPLNVPGIVFNNVTWSLFYELCFYLSFPIVLMVGRSLEISPIASTIGGGLFVAFAPRLIGLDMESFVFLFCGAIAGCLRHEQIHDLASGFPDWLVACLYLAPTTLHTFGYINASQFTWLFSGATLLLLCKAIAGQGTLARALAWRPLAWLGSISYSFYLLHSVAIVFAFRAKRHLTIPGAGEVINVSILATIGFAAAAALAYVSYQLTERFYFASHKPVRLTS